MNSGNIESPNKGIWANPACVERQEGINKVKIKLAAQDDQTHPVVLAQRNDHGSHTRLVLLHRALADRGEHVDSDRIGFSFGRDERPPSGSITTVSRSKDVVAREELGDDLQLVIDVDQPAGSDRRGIDVSHELRVGRVANGEEDVVGRDLFALLCPDYRSRSLLLRLEVGSSDVFISKNQVDPSSSKLLFKRNSELLVSSGVDELRLSVDQGDLLGFAASEFTQDFLNEPKGDDLISLGFPLRSLRESSRHSLQ